jgi:hypothetical protein
MPETLPPAPPALDAGGGRPADSGRYRGAIADLSTAAWDGGGRRRLQRKGWMYFSASTERFSVGYAIVDAGLVASAFVYVHDRQTGRLVEEKASVPFGFAADRAPDWRCPWRLDRGDRHWAIEHDAARGWQVRYSGRRLRLSLDVERGGDGLTAIANPPGRPFAHTWKLCALASRLCFTLDGKTHDLASSSALDFTLGYPPRSSLWNWASLDGTSADGRKLGINLVAHFMNGLENALWRDGELMPLAQATFRYEPSNLLAPWRVRTVDGRVDVVFQPDGQRAEHLDALLLQSRFAQPFGRWAGTVDGVAAAGCGVVEEHAARW